jgi:hypothetical protein
MTKALALTTLVVLSHFVLNSAQTAPPNDDPFAPPARTAATADAKPAPRAKNVQKEEQLVDRYIVREERTPDGVLLKREHVYKTRTGEEVRHGLREMWREDGTIQSIEQFDHGKTSGIALEWHPVGYLWNVIPYSLNTPDGDWVQFDNKRRKLREATYRHGKILGSRLTYDYDRNGKRQIILEEKFEDDGDIFYELGWDKRGKKLHEGEMKPVELLGIVGIPHGKWTYWVGKNRSQEVHGEFRNGKPWEGICHDPDARNMLLPDLGPLNRYSKGKLTEANVESE